MKIMILSSHTPSLFWFRMDLMLDFQKRGYTVLAVGNEPASHWADKFKEYNIEYKQVFVKRNGLNPFVDIKTYKEIKTLIKKEKPDKTFIYQAKTIIYGCLAANANGLNENYALIAGLGSIFRGYGIKNKIIKHIMIAEYKAACKHCRSVFFQNNDDKQIFLDAKIIPDNKARIINGSGVNLEKFQPTPLPEKTAFLFIGRLIKDKGICEYLEACEKIKQIYPFTRCMLVGPYDSNPSALKQEELNYYINKGIIEYFGEQDDVRPFINQCSAFVLPSYFEGTPKTVLEAMAVGRPIITTDAPGCRETVIDEKNGYLIPIKNSDVIVEKMIFFINNEEQQAEMGKMSLKIAKEKFDVKTVNLKIMEIMGLLDYQVKQGEV